MGPGAAPAAVAPGLAPAFVLLPLVLAAAPAATASGAGGAGAVLDGRPPSPGAPRADPVWVERRAWLMGTWLRVHLSASSRESGFGAAGEAFAAVEEAEARWSSWREDTEMARLNGAEPGAEVAVSPAFLSVLSELRRWSHRTGGAFDPAVGPLVDAWDLRAEGRRPSAEELREALRASGLEHLRLDTTAGTVAWRRERVWLDAGAFGKGLALDRARARLRRAGIGSALLDFGGQLVAWGEGPGLDGCWRVAVADPRRRREAGPSLRLCDESASTTSGSERFVRVEGEVRSHVLDPRTGLPAPAWGSVTVVHGDPMVADLLSTALFVMGPEEGLSWAREHGVAALFLRVDGGEVRETRTPAMEGRRAPTGGA